MSLLLFAKHIIALFDRIIKNGLINMNVDVIGRHLLSETIASDRSSISVIFHKFLYN